jgi:LysR family cys regulon transcriptional activator
VNINQLRAICEVVRQDMKISAAAEVLCKAQPGISRQIKELEDELGIQIFYRQRNKICGLTPAGNDVLQVAQRILLDVGTLQAIGEEHATQTVGELFIATTHTHARYSLPAIVERFVREFPDVKLTLRQVSPLQACELVATGVADIAICTETVHEYPDLITIPAYHSAWDVIAAIDHPIREQRPITLEKIAAYPIISQTFSGQGVLTEAFAGIGTAPPIKLAGADADVSKEYVARGMGLAILSKIAYDPTKDMKLAPLNVEHLFPPSVLAITLRRYNYLRSYAMAFLSNYAPHVSPDLVKDAVAGKKVDFEKRVGRLPMLAAGG